MTKTLLAAAFCAALITAPALAQTADTGSSSATTTMGPATGTVNPAVRSAPLPDITPNATDTPAPISGSSSGMPSTTPGPSVNDDGTFNRGASNDNSTPGIITSGGR